MSKQKLKNDENIKMFKELVSVTRIVGTILSMFSFVSKNNKHVFDSVSLHAFDRYVLFLRVIWIRYLITYSNNAVIMTSRTVVNPIYIKQRDL